MVIGRLMIGCDGSSSRRYIPFQRSTEDWKSQMPGPTFTPLEVLMNLHLLEVQECPVCGNGMLARAAQKQSEAQPYLGPPLVVFECTKCSHAEGRRLEVLVGSTACDTYTSS
jgi:predicted RNA-binding Zn-ribbon protein involved in translation (DUF1610 family)